VRGQLVEENDYVLDSDNIWSRIRHPTRRDLAGGGEMTKVWLVLIFWLLWLMLYKQEKEATSAQPTVQYYVVVPY